MAKQLTFSVGIPTFNQADFLEETILSLLNQHRPPDEIVISDHFSTDHTPDIIAKYSREVRGVKPPVGSNVGQQWEFTLSCLSGDWVTLFSSDDIAYPNFVEVLLRGASRRDDAILVRTGWHIIDQDGAVLSSEHLLSVKPVCLPPDTLLEQKTGPKASFASFAVRRQAVEASGGYPPAMESYGDWPMFVQLAPFGSFIREDEIIAGYRVGHDGNKARKRLPMWVRDEQRMFNEVFPLAAQRLGLTDLGWLDRASRHNFLRFLGSASLEFEPSERAELTALFEPWAARVGGEHQLRTFAQGGVVQRPLLHRVRKLIHPYAQNLRTLARGR
jgi:glycosyltransferase involved in cell wall biosynthesis